MRIRLALLAALLILPACAQSADPVAEAADEARDELSAELETMVVPQEDVGGLPLGLRITPDSGWENNRAAAESSLDPNDSADSLRDAGRITGYELTYYDPTQAALESGRGLLSFTTWVEFFRSDSAAAKYLEGRVEYRRGLSGTSPRQGVEFGAVTPFEARVGEAGYGVRENVVFGDDHVFRTLIGFRRGRIVAGAMLVRADREDAAADTERVAGILDSRIQNALTGKVPDEPVLIPKDGVPLDGQQPTTKKPAGAPDLAKVALGPADLPAGTAAAPGKYTRTVSPRITFRRSFYPQGAAIGETRVVGLNNLVSVFESEQAASAGLGLDTQILRSPDALKTFATNFAATSGLRATNIRREEVRLDNGAVGFLTRFDTDAGPLVELTVMVQRGRGTVTLEAFCLPDGFDKEDLLPLVDKVADRLAAALA